MTTQEVYDALIKLNAKISSGPDGLDPSFKKMLLNIADPLRHIFNLTIETGVVPTVVYGSLISD